MSQHDDGFDEGGAPADLSHAGAVVDKAIEYMASQNIGELAIASALLGGAESCLLGGAPVEGKLLACEVVYDVGADAK